MQTHTFGKWSGPLIIGLDYIYVFFAFFRHRGCSLMYDSACVPPKTCFSSSPAKQPEKYGKGENLEISFYTVYQLRTCHDAANPIMICI